MLFSQISVVAVLTVCAAAQNISTAEYFNISSVSLTERASWCTGQQSTCSTLCQGATTANTCTAATLNYTCTCASNSSTPGLEFYQITIPTFECSSAYASCVLDHPNDLTGITACATDINATCGTLDATKATFTSTTSSSAASSTSASATSSSTASSTSASTSASTTASSAAGVVIDNGHQYGLGALALAAVAAFGFML